MEDSCLSFPCDVHAYEIDGNGDVIGQGAAAKVYRAFCRPMLAEVAVKVVDLELSERPLDELAAEALLLRQLRHPHLLPLHCSFVAGSELWMVSPLAAGDAASLLRRRYPSGLPEPLLATLARDVLSALDYLHRQAGVTHRDVKAANVLVDDGGLALLADLGAAARSGGGGDGENNSEAQLTAFAGSPCWMAPEVAAGELYDCRADVWSFGITLLELARGRPPYYSLPLRELWTQLAHGEPPALEDEPGGRRWSRELKDLVARCLAREPRQRPMAAQLLAHPFFGKAASRQEVAAQLLGYLPMEERLPSTASMPMLSLSNSSIGSAEHAGGGLLGLRRSSSVSGISGGLASSFSW